MMSDEPMLRSSAAVCDRSGSNFLNISSESFENSFVFHR